VPSVVRGSTPRIVLTSLAKGLIPWVVWRRVVAWLSALIRENPEVAWRVMERRLAEGHAGDPEGDTEQVMLSPVAREFITEPYRTGGLGTEWEGRLFARAWGFHPRDIACEAHVWHGERDRLAPMVMGRYWATRLPHCAATFYPDEGHSVLNDHLHDILSWLAS
jgi:pimeloyl-ACP methyl ester carboxylesterase